MKVYEIRALQFRDYYLTKALAAQALGTDVNAINTLVAANIAAGKPGFPIAATVPVSFGGMLAGLRTPTSTQVMMDEIDVRESLT
jgi:hypothetical protein